MRFLRNNEPREEELAALADGSLAPERLAALEAQVAASSELADRLAEQRRAVVLTRSAAAEVEAPAALRARIDARRRPSRVSARQRPDSDRHRSGCCGGRGHRSGGTPLRPDLRRTLPGCSRPDEARTHRQR